MIEDVSNVWREFCHHRGYIFFVSYKNPLHNDVIINISNFQVFKLVVEDHKTLFLELIHFGGRNVEHAKLQQLHN